jgi:ribonucleotide monophosphatase NagD (HAD superfamily)
MHKALILDLEGTLTSSGTVLPGSVELITFLNKNNVPYYIITNTVSKTAEQMEENLINIGINILKKHIINPISVLNRVCP